MIATHHPDDLAHLRARLARLERRHRLPRRALPLLLAALLVALVPLATLAANPFTDLNPGSPHNANIDAIYTAGITTGCVPNAAYCPNDLVTREQMASFLARTAGLGGNKPVANALTAQSALSAQSAANATNAQNAVNAQSATSAQNAAQLGGQPASAYARTAALVAHEGLVSGSTPLPRAEGSFVATGTRGLLLISGSAYRTNAGFLRIDVNVSPVGQPTGNGTSASVYTNEGSSHRALRGGMGMVTLTPGTTYEFVITRDPLTLLDGNDAIRYLLLELP